MEARETVFVTQRFDGKQLKNIYHVEVNLETYFRLEKLRRELKLETHSQVIQYLVGTLHAKSLLTMPSDTDNLDEILNWLIENISCLNQQQRKMLLDAIVKTHPEIVSQVAETLRGNYLDKDL